MQFATILLSSIAILVQLAYPATGSKGQVVIYLEQIQRRGADFLIHLDHIRLHGLLRQIEIAPFENIIKSDELRTQQYLLAESMIETGNYDTLATSGIMEIISHSENAPQWRQIPYDNVLPISLIVSRNQSTTLFFGITIEIPQDTTSNPKMIISEVHKTIPPSTL